MNTNLPWSFYCSAPLRSNKKVRHLLFDIDNDSLSDESLVKMGRFCSRCEMVLCACNCLHRPNCSTKICNSCHCACIAFIRDNSTVFKDSDSEEQKCRNQYIQWHTHLIDEIVRFRDARKVFRSTATAPLKDDADMLLRLSTDTPEIQIKEEVETTKKKSSGAITNDTIAEWIRENLSDLLSSRIYDIKEKMQDEFKCTLIPQARIEAILGSMMKKDRTLKFGYKATIAPFLIKDSELIKPDDLVPWFKALHSQFLENLQKHRKPPRMNIFDALKAIHKETKKYFNTNPFAILEDTLFRRFLFGHDLSISKNYFIHNPNPPTPYAYGQIDRNTFPDDIIDTKILDDEDSNSPTTSDTPMASESREEERVSEYEDEHHTKKRKRQSSTGSSSRGCMASVKDLREFLQKNESTLDTEMEVIELEQLFRKKTGKEIRESSSVKITSSENKCILLPALKGTKFCFITGINDKTTIRKPARILHRDHCPETLSPTTITTSNIKNEIDL